MHGPESGGYSKEMNPLLYALIGLLAGAGVATIVFAITRRKGDDDSELLKRFELLERAQERWSGLLDGIITHKFAPDDFEKPLLQHEDDEIKSVIEWATP